MKIKQRLFIYDRRERIVLILLILMIAVFTFTLGIHLGKRVGLKLGNPIDENPGNVSRVPDQIPNRQELHEQEKGAQQVVDEVLNTEIKDEVTRSGIKLDTPRQVDLPSKAKTPQSGATTLNKSSSPAVQYSLQLGSYPTLEGAQSKLKSLPQLEWKPFIKKVEIQGKGIWYRLYIGDFPNKDAAEQAGKKYHGQTQGSSYIVVKLSD